MSHTPQEPHPPPPYVKQVALIPVLPSQNERYRTLCDPPSGSQGPSDLPERPPASSQLPEGWSQHVHPEGACFWANKRMQIVTTTDPSNRRDEEIMNAAWQRVSTAHEIGSAELYLKVTHHDEIEFYLINFELRTVFWTEDVHLDDFDVPLPEDDVELKSFLLAEYWLHIEYFAPIQHLDDGAAAGLLSILKHGELDDSTSPASTCPYSAEECRRHAAVLQDFPDVESPDEYRSTGYYVATVARLWVAIVRARHMNNWGTKRARIDRLQGADQFIQSQLNPSILLSLGDAVCFFASRDIFERLTLLWNGRIVYQRHWAVFLEDMRAEWSRMACLSMIIWLTANFVFDPTRTTTPIILASSVAAMSAIISVILYYRHSKYRLSTSNDISAYIVRVESVLHGLRPLSIIYALPRALTLQAALLLQYGLVQQNSTVNVVLYTLPVMFITLVFILFGGLNLL